MGGRVALDRAEALLRAANLEQGYHAALLQLTQARCDGTTRERGIDVSKIAESLTSAPPASAPSSPGCSAVSLGARASLPTARRHTQPADWAESKIWRIGPALVRALERPVLHIVCARSPSSTPPIPSSHLCSGNRLVLCSSVFLCVVGVLCFAGVSLAFRYAALPPLPSRTPLIFFALPWRAGAACGLVHARG